GVLHRQDRPAPLALAGHQRGVGARRPRCRGGFPTANWFAFAAAGVVFAPADARQIAGNTARTGASVRPIRAVGCYARCCARRSPAVRSSTCPMEVELAHYENVQRHVTEARYLGDYKIWLEFNDGRKGVVDLADDLYGEEMEPLRDRDRFAQFYLDYGLASIAWLDGQDFTPEFLYERLKEMH